MSTNAVLLDIAEKYEDQALSLGLLSTAIKINWIKNSLRYDNVSHIDMFERLMQIVLLGR